MAENAALIMMIPAPPSSFVTGTVFRHIAGHGVMRNWHGDDVDFLGQNTFEDVSQCLQTYVTKPSESCPRPAPCPR